jgi:hypothetical protein
MHKRIAIFVILALLLPLLPEGASTEARIAALGPQSSVLSPERWLSPRGGQPFFVVGANYEGATDRAWAMWEDEKFSADLISADFARARSVGINTLRIFVQRPLRDDINAGDFSKLDTVISLARQHNLWLIVTFTDWAEPDLTRAGALNARIAARLKNEPHILSYDAKNEPQFTDIVGAIYPTTTVGVPLQSPDITASYGERVAREELAEYRRSTEGRAVIPARMNEDQAYAVANSYKLYLEFLDESSEWVLSKSGVTTIDYIASPDSAKWGPYLAALDATLGAWVGTQMDPVRAADPGRPVTVGYSNMILAAMPSNRALTFQSIHRFTAHGAGGLNSTLRVLDALQRTFPNHPVMLEEFGYPGQVKAQGGGVTGYDPRTTANLEGAVWAYLYANGFAGGAKWMLNNFSEGYDPAQNTYGLFDNNNQPKHSAHALRHISSLIARTPPGGEMSSVRSDESSASSYSYVNSGGIIAGGKAFTSTLATYQASAPSQFVLGTAGGSVTLFATDAATVTLNLPQLFGMPTTEIARVSLLGLDPSGRAWTPPAPVLEGDKLRVRLQPLYSYRVAVTPRAMLRAEPILAADSVYFAQTGHNLGGEFLPYWQKNGGLAIYGYPISEAFREGEYLVQYYERNRFEFHPENRPPYNVLLGRLGADLTRGRVFPKVEPFTSTPGHRYFPETGHSLHNAFLGYWERHGGLAQFGFPISEELRERSATDGKEYTVQYFERARFEYHPEYRGTDAEVLLGLLGVATIDARGWGR